MKIYNLGKDGSSEIPDGSEISLNDLVDSQKNRIENIGKIRIDQLGTIKRLTDLKSTIGRKIFKCIFMNNGIDITSNIKDFESIHFSLRKKVIDTKKEMLELIDSHEFIFGIYPYILLAFTFRSKLNGYEGINSIDSLYSVIEKIYSNETLEISSLLCAHRENKEVKENSLREHPNMIGLQKILNIFFGIFDNLETAGFARRLNISFKEPGGDKEGIKNIFPNIFFNYLEKGEIGQIPDILEGHIAAMNLFLQSISYDKDKYNISVQSLSKEYEGINDLRGNLMSLKESNDLMRITMEHTLSEVNRVVEIHGHQSKRINIEEAIKANTQGSKPASSRIEDLIISYMNGFEPMNKAINETLLYYYWGLLTKESDGLAFGFERDHSLYQTLAFSLGYGSETFPLIYGRHSDSRYVKFDLKNLGHRQFWYYW